MIDAPAPTSDSEIATVRVVQPAGAVSVAHREQLLEWTAQLARLIAKRKEIGLRKSSGPLERHFNSSIMGAHDVITATCAPLRRALALEAATLVAPYFPRLGDAQQCAMGFPAIVDFSFFLAGPEGGDLDTLAAHATETARLINMVIEGGELWSYHPER